MDDRKNTIAGWVLAGCGAALGLSILSGMAFESERPEKMGYPIEGVEVEGGEGEAAVAPIAVLLAAADAVHGSEVFKKCTACHTINQGGPNGIGPNLYATVGEPIAKGKNGFAFSDALKSVGGTWTFEALDAWLTSPRKFANGTKMTFAGLSDPQDRADVILYLNQQGANVPLPAAPAPTPEAGNVDEAEANATTGADTANIANEATPAPGAPSVDPNAAAQASEQQD
jgi:cytochrome c